MEIGKFALATARPVTLAFFIASTVNVTVTVPTTNRVGLLLLLGLLAGGSLLVMRRKATIG